MLAALLIVFREVLEAGLIVGIVLAATEGVPGRGRWIGAGILVGLAGSAVVALSAERLGALFSGSGQELFNAVILLAAVAMLSWHIVWMAGHSRELSGDMKALGRSVVSGENTLTAMAAVVGVAILREGAEVVLFLYGVAASGTDTPWSLLLGGLSGVGLGVALSWLIYRGLLVIPARRLFSVTNGLLSLLAAGMAGQAVVFLAKAGVLPPLADEVWDTSSILRDDGVLGRAMHAIVGYSDRPMGIQVAAYVSVLIVLVLLSRTVGRAPSPVRRA